MPEDKLMKSFTTLLNVALSTAGTRYPLPNYAHVHCLVFINFLQASMNISGYILFLIEKFSDASLLLCQMLFCCIRQKKWQVIGRNIQHLLPHHHHLSLILWINIIGYITFKAILLETWQAGSCLSPAKKCIDNSVNYMEKLCFVAENMLYPIVLLYSLSF